MATAIAITTAHAPTTNDAPVVDSAAVVVTEDSQDNVLGLTAPSDADDDTLTITVTALPDSLKGSVTLVQRPASPSLPS